ncbi:GDP-mannose 4,6-dehydratase, partial [Candidatus Micrarchaeota archaeon]|nr:GDP-mannose 4,6-dehydratase [Candidatus Micrarchaeota archaeon]
MKRVLITGINGFVGSHLSEFILGNDLGEVYGTVRTTNESMRNIHQIMNKINLINCDITDFHSIDRVIEDVCPDYIFHLAAQAFVPSSWKAPVETINTNVIGSLNLFEAVRKNECNPTVQIAGSSEEYGMVYENEVPIKEENPLRPLSPYGVSKVAMDLLGYQYNKSYGLKIIRTRGFNHTGPRRGEAYVCSNWSQQIAEIEVKGKEPLIYVGNLESKRDFT